MLCVPDAMLIIRLQRNPSHLCRSDNRTGFCFFFFYIIIFVAVVDYRVVLYRIGRPGNRKRFGQRTFYYTS